MRVIVDTNALLIPAKFGIDIYEELECMGYQEIIIPESVIKELEGLIQDKRVKGSTRRAAQLGYHMLLRHITKSTHIHIERGAEDETGAMDTDSMLIRMAKRIDAAVLTGDAELRHRLQREGIRTLYLRGGNRLVAD